MDKAQDLAAIYVDGQDCTIQDMDGDLAGYSGGQMVSAFMAGYAANERPEPMRVAGDREPPAITLLREAAARFREYEESHMAKVAAEHEVSPHDPDPVTIRDATARAHRNAEIAGRIEAFLAYRAAQFAKPKPFDGVKMEIDR